MPRILEGNNASYLTPSKSYKIVCIAFIFAAIDSVILACDNYRLFNKRVAGVLLAWPNSVVWVTPARRHN
jgi:hypothetical protein